MTIQPLLERAGRLFRVGGKSMEAAITVLPDLDLYFCKFFFFFNMVKCTPLHIADGCKNWYYFFGKKLAIHFKSQKLSLYSVI